jgi:predicted dehydrogenase
MALAAVKSGRVAGMNFEWRYLRERQAIERSLRENRLGDIFHVNWSEAWSLWPHIQQDDPSWDWQAEEGGGMLGAIGSHIIDALCHWFGPLVSVKGNTVNHVPKRKRQDNWVTTTADDSFSFLGKFECGATCTVSCTIAAVGRPLQVEIFGSQGTLRLNGHDLAMATSDSKEFRAMNVISTVDVSEFPMDIKPYVHAQWALYNDLAQAIEGVTCDSLPSLDDAVRVQAVMDAIHS